MKAELDITQNIRAIEKLKVNLLEEISMLYTDMLKLGAGDENRTEILARIVMAAYLLSAKLGIRYDELDEKMVNKLRLELLGGDSALRAEAHALLTYLGESRDDE